MIKVGAEASGCYAKHFSKSRSHRHQHRHIDFHPRGSDWSPGKYIHPGSMLEWEFGRTATATAATASTAAHMHCGCWKRHGSFGSCNRCDGRHFGGWSFCSGFRIWSHLTYCSLNSLLLRLQGLVWFLLQRFFEYRQIGQALPKPRNSPWLF